MNLLLLLLLFQDRPVEASIEAFLKGDAAARAELVKLGAYAIRPLQKAREKGPEKIDALILDAKAAAAYPQQPEFLTSELKRSFRLREVALRTMITLLLDQFDRGASVVLDRSIDAETKVSHDVVDAPLWRHLDRLCSNAGMDYGFFHGAVILAKPERLWPGSMPPKAPGLTGEPLDRAKALVEKLGDESLEIRESAMAGLVKLGAPVVSLLEANLNRDHAEITARCSKILTLLRPPPWVAFGPPAYMRQKLSSTESALLKRLQLWIPDVQYHELSLEFVAIHLHKYHDVKLELPGDDGGKVTIDGRGLSLVEVLSLITQTRDFDYVIRNQAVVIDTREAIEKSLPKEK